MLRWRLQLAASRFDAWCTYFFSFADFVDAPP
jgi:hypothetical protein